MPTVGASTVAVCALLPSLGQRALGLGPSLGPSLGPRALGLGPRAPSPTTTIPRTTPPKQTPRPRPRARPTSACAAAARRTAVGYSAPPSLHAAVAAGAAAAKTSNEDMIAKHPK